MIEEFRWFVGSKVAALLLAAGVPARASAALGLAVGTNGTSVSFVVDAIDALFFDGEQSDVRTVR